MFTISGCLSNVKKVKTILFLFVFVTSAARVYSEEVSWVATSTLWSKYLARPGLVLYDGPTIHNEVVASWKGVYGGLWASTGLGRSDVLRQEYQSFLGYRRKVGEVIFDANIRYDAFRDIDRISDDLLMFDARLDFTNVPLVKPYIAMRQFLSVSGNDSVDGGFYWLGLKRSMNLGGGISTTVDLSVAYCDGALSRGRGWVYQKSAIQLSVPITKQLTLSPQLVLQLPLSAPSFTLRPIVVGGVSLNYRF
jgi:hypothetical protein